jgi:hypothetical protein
MPRLPTTRSPRAPTQVSHSEVHDLMQQSCCAESSEDGASSDSPKQGPKIRDTRKVALCLSCSLPDVVSISRAEDVPPNSRNNW